MEFATLFWFLGFMILSVATQQFVVSVHLPHCDTWNYSLPLLEAARDFWRNGLSRWWCRICKAKLRASTSGTVCTQACSTTLQTRSTLALARPPRILQPSSIPSAPSRASAPPITYQPLRRYRYVPSRTTHWPPREVATYGYTANVIDSGYGHLRKASESLLGPSFLRVPVFPLQEDSDLDSRKGESSAHFPSPTHSASRPPVTGETLLNLSKNSLSSSAVRSDTLSAPATIFPSKLSVSTVADAGPSPDASPPPQSEESSGIAPLQMASPALLLEERETSRIINHSTSETIEPEPMEVDVDEPIVYCTPTKCNYPHFQPYSYHNATADMNSLLGRMKRFSPPGQYTAYYDELKQMRAQWEAGAWEAGAWDFDPDSAQIAACEGVPMEVDYDERVDGELEDDEEDLEYV